MIKELTVKRYKQLRLNAELKMSIRIEQVIVEFEALTGYSPDSIEVKLIKNRTMDDHNANNYLENVKINVEL